MPRHLSSSAKVVIIGAGLAEAATAFFLTQRGLRNIRVLERETVPGIHASGRNAAMVRQVVPDAPVAALGREGTAFIRDTLERGQCPRPLFRQSGSLLLARGADWQRLFVDSGEDAGLLRTAG